jgi:hypothetical protein
MFPDKNMVFIGFLIRHSIAAIFCVEFMLLTFLPRSGLYVVVGVILAGFTKKLAEVRELRPTGNALSLKPTVHRAPRATALNGHPLKRPVLTLHDLFYHRL